MDKFNNMNETEILNLAKDGDNEAISFYYSKKYKYISIKLASEWTNSFIEPEDLMQEGMIGLLAAIKSYDESKKNFVFLSYAYTCVGNSIQTALRKVNRKKDFPKNSLVPFEKEFVDGKANSLSAEDSFLAEESVSMLLQQLDKSLSKMENSVLRLFLVGCSYNEIAQRLNKSPKAIDNALQRIRKKLKEVSF
ncbi:MAG: sigma-70 family RNA polymerase sigma factor [Anaerotruncus sp.]|nr:MAG: sigma-70 family RNA polymerase sigma factor [Anaerotruncus sp.]